MFQITKRSSSQCSVLETDYSSHVTRAREHRLSLLVTPSKGHFFLVGRFVGAGPLHSEFDRKAKINVTFGWGYFLRGGWGVVTFGILRYYYVYESIVFNCLVFCYRSASTRYTHQQRLHFKALYLKLICTIHTKQFTMN